MEELLPPLTPGKQEQANPKNEIYSFFPPQLAGLKGQGVMLCSPGTPQISAIPGLCSCPGTDLSLPAPCKGQGADTSDDLTISFSPFLLSFLHDKFAFYLALFSLLPERIPSM